MAARKKAVAKAKDGEPTGTSTKQRAKRASAKSRRKVTSGRTALKANKAAKEAKKHGATGRHLGAVRQSLRDTMIVARVAQGVPYAAIAAEAQVSVRTVEEVVKRTRKIRSPLDRTPMELLEDLVRLFELDAADFEAMAALHMADQPNVAVRSKRAAVETRKAFAELLAHVGKLPTDLELFRSEMEMQQIGERMVEVMQAVVAGEKSAEDAYEFFRQIALSPREFIDSTARELPPG